MGYDRGTQVMPESLEAILVDIENMILSTKYGVRSTSSRSVREKIFPQPVPWKFSSSRSTPYSVSKCRILIARYY